MKSLAHHAIDLDIWPYDAASGRGVLRSAVLRASRTTGEVLVTLVAGRRNKMLGTLADRIAQGVSQVVGVWLHVNDEPGNAIFVRDGDGVVGVRGLVGKETISETVNGVDYSIGPGDFFQTNPATAEVLYQRTMQRLDLQQGTPVVDLYCGVGGFALQAARRTGWALGIEEVDGAVGRARDTARRNGITGAEFLSDTVLYALPDLVKRLKDVRPVITVNPARRGLEDGVIDGIVGLSPRRIAYISCNARTLARDLQMFRERGYTVGPIDLFDMFPNTPHVETLTILEAPDADAASARAPRRKVVRR
jgi:23S rRNA (uracil1939-C5)-methyltransferase